MIIYTLSLWRPAHKQEHTRTHMQMRAHGSTHALKPRCAGTGTISASSLFHSALCSSHFPPVSDPLPLLHFNPPPVSPRPDRGVSTESKSGERGSCPLWVAKRLPFERSNPLHHISHNLLCFPITLWESVSASSARLAPPLLFSSPLLIRLYLLHL